MKYIVTLLIPFLFFVEVESVAFPVCNYRQKETIKKDTSKNYIHSLTKEGNFKKVVKILNKDSTLLNAIDANGYTPLHWALIRANWDLANFLLDRGANINATGSDGGTPLHCAANHDNLMIVERLLREGAKIDSRNLWGNTPLALASQRGCVNTVRVLIEAGSDINSQSAEGWTPLHYAFKSGHTDMQILLLDSGASDTIPDNYGKRPSDYIFARPIPIMMDPVNYHQYEGTYYIAPGSFFRVYLRDEKLFLEDFALDEIYPIACDQFYDYREPWRIRFFRDPDGNVDMIAVDFQRQTVIGKKVASDDDTPCRPGLGVAIRPVSPEDVSPEILKTLFFDMRANANVLLVTLVGENTPSYRAGIQVNDIILEFNSQPLFLPGDLIRLLYNAEDKKEVVLKILRNDRVVYLSLIL